MEEEIEMPPADSDEDLKNKLVLLDEKVKGNKEPLAVFPVRILSPSKKDKNSKVISFDKQIEGLQKHEDKDFDLKEAFQRAGENTNLRGIELGKLLADRIKKNQSKSKEPKTNEKSNAGAATSVIELLKEEFNVSFLRSEVSLCGYMFKEGEQWRELYFWNGIADAIGWDENEGRFVIVEWKVKEEKKINQTEAFKPFKFQTLVYAKLLKLLLNLDYLPSILIVIILFDDENGKKVRAGFFKTTPNSPGDAYQWSVEEPDTTIKIQPGSLFHEDLKEGKVKEDMLLSELFSGKATLTDLRKIFNTPPLEVIPKHNNA